MTAPHDSRWVVPGRLLTEEGELAPCAHLVDGMGASHLRRPETRTQRAFVERWAPGRPRT